MIRSLSVLVDVTELLRATRQLAERDRTMQNLLANVPGMAYRCANDPEWTELLLSDGCGAVTGYEPAELIGPGDPTYGGLIVPEDRQGVWDRIQAALTDGSPGPSRIASSPRQARLAWVWERGVGVHGDEGTLQYLDGFISDITDLHAAEDALREREQMLSAVVASLPGAVYRSELRAPWRTTFLSEGFRSLLDRDPETIVAGDVVWADFVHPDDLHMLAEDTERDRAAGSPTTESEYRILTAGGEPRWVLDRAMFVRDADGEPVELIGMLFDVTGLHGALAAKAESERRLRTVIDNIPGMVYRSQAVAPWSDEFIAGGDVSLTGYSVEELTAPDFRWDKVMYPEDVPRLEEASRIGAETGRGHAEYRIRAKDGAERWLLDRFTLIKDEDGVPMAQEGILIDVTEQHRVEGELRASRGCSNCTRASRPSS